MDALAQDGMTDLIILPIGFISDHMEVLYDLDTEAVEKAAELNMILIRAATVGTHPRFVAMIRELITERMTENPIRLALGSRGANHDICPMNCCLLDATRPVRAEQN
jgi:ferrochelatase